MFEFCTRAIRKSGALHILVIAALFILLPVVKVAAGVLVAPTVVFLSETNRTGRITLRNPSDVPQEVNVYFSFGLPISDSLGNVYVMLQDSVTNDPKSALGWVKAFPRTVILPPGENQTVRLVIKPPDDLPDGEYWARIVVRSQDARTAVPEPDEAAGISTQLNMVIQTAIMLKYRTGELISNLELTSAGAKLHDNIVQVLLDLVSRGNVSYMGILHCRVLDKKDIEIGRGKINLAVYRNLRRRMDIPITAENHNPPYRVEVRITSEGRTDVPPPDMIAGNEIIYTLSLE
ncbi:MAG: hypothetical protein V3W18_09655 [candidate division Zixibacteria bacterium]